MLTIAVAAERANNERRVALVPSVVNQLIEQHKLTVLVEKSAGEGAGYFDDDYLKAGAQVVDTEQLYRKARLFVRVSPPEGDALQRLPEGSMVVGFLGLCDGPQLKIMQERRLTALAVERMPRSTRAQTMDALSSQRSVAGYHAVLAAGALYDRFLPMLTGPTGTVRPSTVLIIGAGVAGLQATATARRLGAMVEVSDIRAAAREQVESLGARFIGADIKADADGGYARELTAEEKQAQTDKLAQHVAKANILLTTAEIPNRPAPKIISRQMVETMNTGSIIIDLAAGSGGNCELTQVGKTIQHAGVSIYGPHNLAAEIPAQASDLYAQNLRHLLALLIEDGNINLDQQDDIVNSICVLRDGQPPEPPSTESP